MRRQELQPGADRDLVRDAAGVLHRLRYFQGVEAAFLEKLVLRGAIVDLATGETLIREGDPLAQEMYVLLSGHLVVQSRDRVILTLQSPGDVVGELAILQAPPRTADVLAAADSRVLAIRPEVLRLPEFAELAAIFYMMLSHSLAQKLRATTDQSREQLSQAEREAGTDPLTGLANRKRLDAFLERLEASGESAHLSLIIADIDHFKQYNDANGHPMGDAVLAKFGMILQSHIRSGDLAARYGGEEFVVVLPGCDGADATRIANQLREALAAEGFPHASGSDRCVTATFGVAVHRGRGFQDTLQRADQALYRGKAAGRNVVVADEA